MKSENFEIFFMIFFGLSCSLGGPKIYRGFFFSKYSLYFKCGLSVRREFQVPGPFFHTNFAHLDILENSDSISISLISVKKGGKLRQHLYISDFGQKRRKTFLAPILPIWIF